MTTADIQRVREATDIGALIENVVRLRRVPGNVGSGLCPFHDEKTASFRVNLPGSRFPGRWRCHSCGAHGDALDFVQRIDSCDLPTAVRRLASDAGITLTDKPETPTERRKRERKSLEREMADWYFREQWKQARRGLNRAMEAGPYPIGTGWNLAGQIAEFYGARLRWIETNRRADAGLVEFRLAGVTETQYRQWLCIDLGRHAALLDFAEIVLSASRRA